MNPSEDQEIDRAIKVCQIMEGSLQDSLDIVKRMNEKYNAPGRYGSDELLESLGLNTDRKLLSTQLSNLSLSGVPKSKLVETEVEKTGPRSSHEIDATYTNLKWSCIKIKRDMEATVAHVQHLNKSAENQKRTKHRMLISSQSKNTKCCTH